MKEEHEDYVLVTGVEYYRGCLMSMSFLLMKIMLMI